MQITHLSHSDAGGGAAIAAYRLHRSLVAAGLGSRMLVLRKRTEDHTVVGVAKGRLAEVGEVGARLLERAPLQLYRRRGTGLWSPGAFGWPGIDRHPLVRAADLVALYWVSGGLLSLRQIGRLLAQGKPVVWRLSDMWPFTGGCHYAGPCRGFAESCGRCPQLGSGRALDLSRLGARRRRRWPIRDLTMVAPTSWIATQARSSALLAEARIEVIPTGLDLDLYRPIAKPLARQLLRLPAAGRLVLFGAAGGAADPRKGHGLLMEALALLRQAPDLGALHLATFGGRAGAMPPLPFPARDLGLLHDDLTRVLAYSASDLFVAPSLEDNLPNTVLEAMACGTPVVAFETGGLPEVVQDGINGHLAGGPGAAALARALGEALADPDRLAPLAAGARQTAILHHDARNVAARYAALYQELLLGATRSRSVLAEART